MTVKWEVQMDQLRGKARRIYELTVGIMEEEAVSAAEEAERLRADDEGDHPGPDRFRAACADHGE